MLPERECGIRLRDPLHRNDSKYRNFVSRLVHHVDNNVGRFDQLTGGFDETGPSDVRETWNRKPIDARENAPNQFCPSARVVPGNPVEDVVEIASSGLTNDNLHSLMRRLSRSLNSSSVSLRGFGVG